MTKTENESRSQCDNLSPNLSPPDPSEPAEMPPDPPSDPDEVSQETREKIIRLHAYYGSRRIADRIGLGRKQVRTVLEAAGLSSTALSSPPSQSKLDPFREQVQARVEKRLTTTRILRELKELGYQGSRTILAVHVRRLRSQLGLARKRKVKRRFETPPAQEMQTDWSPYTIPIAGRPTQVHALSVLLCSSRKLFIHFFHDERQSTLLEGLAMAFVYFCGCALRLVLDNMATAVLGRLGANREPLWHPRFLAFVRHYGTQPYACRVRDPDRKGKDEKAFRLLEDDFLRGSSFASWEDLHERLQIWLDETPGVGNQRLHGTTRQVPNQAFVAEQPLLIQLPERRFAVHEDGIRLVDDDSTVSIAGTRYSVPSALAGRSVAVRLYAEHFEVLDPQGRIAFTRCYATAADKGKLLVDATHYASLPRRPKSGSGERLDEAFVKRFPDLAPFVDGLKRRFKTLAPIQIRSLLRLVDRFGEPAFREAAQRAQGYRRFDAAAIERILERAHPGADSEPIVPLTGTGPLVLGEVERGSLDGYANLDRAPASSPVPAPPTSATPSPPGTASTATPPVASGPLADASLSPDPEEDDHGS